MRTAHDGSIIPLGEFVNTTTRMSFDALSVTTNMRQNQEAHLGTGVIGAQTEEVRKTFEKILEEVSRER